PHVKSSPVWTSALGSGTTSGVDCFMPPTMPQHATHEVPHAPQTARSPPLIPDHGPIGVATGLVAMLNVSGPPRWPKSLLPQQRLSSPANRHENSSPSVRSSASLTGGVGEIGVS